MHSAIGVFGLESDGADRFFYGGGPGILRVVRRPQGLGSRSGMRDGGIVSPSAELAA